MNIINTSNLNQARKQIQELKKSKKKVIVQAQDDEFNRKILENPDVDILINLEFHNKKDRLKQRDSGLNEVLCKLATKNKITIAIDISKIKSLQPKDKAIILSRIIQNIRLCKRTKTKLIIYPKEKYSKQDIMSLFLTLKASSQQAKEAFNFF